MSLASKILLGLSLAAGLGMYGSQFRDLAIPDQQPASLRERCENAAGSELFVRTELYFGLSRPDGEVTEEAFRNFVDMEVTPRFPNGLTVLDGKGQFRDATGNRIAEASKLLILLYPFQDKNDAAFEPFHEIEAIRTKYKKAFQQESVLRADEQSCLSF